MSDTPANSVSLCTVNWFGGSGYNGGQAKDIGKLLHENLTGVPDIVVAQEFPSTISDWKGHLEKV
jgi:hypothetical protein